MSTNDYIANIQSYNPEYDINLAIQLILKAFEKKSNSSDKEVLKLKDILMDKESKIDELQNMVNCICSELKSYKEENNKLKEENSYLIEMTKILNEDNDKLQNFKYTILNSIDGETHMMKINKMQVANLIEDKKPVSVPSPKQNTNKSMLNQDINKSSSPKSNNKYISSIDEILEKLNLKLYAKKNPKILLTNSSEDENNLQIKQNQTTRNDNSIYQTSNFHSNKFDTKISEMKKKFKSNTNLNQINNSFSSGIVRNYREINDQYKSAVFNDEHDLNNGRKYEGKSNQYILSSKFFNECRIVLRKEVYEELVSVINEKGDNNFNEDYNNQRIQDILKGHPMLIRDFQIIFPKLTNKY